jgi:DNA-binding response OmpR family regulator
MNATTGAQRYPLLVIEDEPAVQAFLRAALTRHGFNFLLVASGKEGLEMLKTGTFCGVLSDMRTPGGVNGAGVHTWLRENQPELTSRMLFITGDIVNEETRHVLQTTGVPCIEKPFRVNELINALRKVLG